MSKKNNIGLIAGIVTGAAIGIAVGVALYKKAKADEIETIYLDEGEEACCGCCSHTEEATELEH